MSVPSWCSCTKFKLSMLQGATSHAKAQSDGVSGLRAYDQGLAISGQGLRMIHVTCVTQYHFSRNILSSVDLGYEGAS